MKLTSAERAERDEMMKASLRKLFIQNPKLYNQARITDYSLNFLRFIKSKKITTVNELAAKRNIPISTAANQLRVLLKAGYVEVEKVRKCTGIGEFIYRVK